MCDADVIGLELRDAFGAQVHAVRAPHVLGQPAELLDVLQGRAAELLQRELLLLDRLDEMRVQLQAELAGELRRLTHQLLGDGERRTRRDGNLHVAAVGELRSVLRRSEHFVAVLHDGVGWQSPVGLA